MELLFGLFMFYWWIGNPRWPQYHEKSI